MHLPHSLTVSDIRRPSVIYDFLSFNAMILLGILRGRLARNSTDEIYCNLHRESGCLSLSLSHTPWRSFLIRCCLCVIYDFFFFHLAYTYLVFLVHSYIPHFTFLTLHIPYPTSYISYSIFHIPCSIF